MRLVEAHLTKLVILHVENNDLILLLQHLDSLNSEDIRRHHRPTLVGRLWIVETRERGLSALPHNFGGLRFEDRIMEIANEPGGIARAVGPAAKVAPRTRASPL